MEFLLERSCNPEDALFAYCCETHGACTASKHMDTYSVSHTGRGEVGDGGYRLYVQTLHPSLTLLLLPRRDTHKHECL